MSMRAWLGVALLALGACGILDPDDHHPLEGTYDLTMSFTQSTRRGPCPFPQTGYCYSTDSIAFDREGVLVVSNVHDGTFDATVTMQSTVYDGPDPIEGDPMISAGSNFELSRTASGGTALRLGGTLDEAGGISGDVRLSNGIMGSSTGTFTGTRRH